MKASSVKNAAMFNMLSKYAVIVIQIIYTAILSRILTPEDYGIVAIINVFLNFFNVLADMGIGSAVIQRQDLEQHEINGIFTFSCLISVLLAVGFMVLSIPISFFYADNVYLKLGPLLSISVFFNTLNTVPNALLMKEKKFIRIGIRQIVVAIACSIIAVILAMVGWQYYSLIIYSILYALFTFAWNLKNSKLRLIAYIDNSCIKKIGSYSAHLFGFNVVNYFSRNLDNLLIGKFLGTTEVGNYNKAYQLMLYPINNLVRVITPVLHPFLANRQEEKDYLYNSFVKTVKLFSLVSIYIQFFCFFLSNELVSILYGKQWTEVMICFKILSLSIWSQMICSASGAFFQVLNKTNLQFRRGIIDTILMIIGISIGVYCQSIKTIAICVVIAYNSNFITMLYFLIKKSFKRNICSFLMNFLPDVIIGCGVFVSFILVSNIAINNMILSFVIKLLVTGIVFFITLILTRQLRFFIQLLPKTIVSRLPSILSGINKDNSKIHKK